MLSDAQKRQFERAEQQYLREPKQALPHCPLCGDTPADEQLYKLDDVWMCCDCVLDRLEHRNIYSFRGGMLNG